MRYYFHADNGRRFRDQEGTELLSDSDARVEAARVLGQLINEDPLSVWHETGLRITVTDQDDKGLFAVGVVATISTP